MMSTVWFTSDLHIGHGLAAAARGYRCCAGQDGCPSCVAAHDDELASAWDAVVHTSDQVWVMGDVSVGGREELAYALNWIADRPGEKHLVPGNHDPIHPMYRDSHTWHSAYRQVFASVQPFARRKVGGRDVLLSHFPYEGDSGPTDRHVEYRLRDHGLPILHGHTHRPWRATTSTPIYRVDEGASVPPNQFHVGVDAWDLWPVHIDEVADLMREVGW
ncbi:metallophosphoesterase [Mycobacterium phage Cracklewink]|uniref:Metallophosphoesterase n=1 Tax=Mycobacterium phage Bipper TaxID=1805457 RepID=A0A142F2L8_9CAUD|nr:phosphoesterase [Mycobacterium phage Bipper]AMQ67025.1 metallophosphoesterase [Mycobacterium phage Bipper]QDF19377.1 metallophosphoesterase [Mycobacterium phage Cracklewink]